MWSSFFFFFFPPHRVSVYSYMCARATWLKWLARTSAPSGACAFSVLSSGSFTSSAQSTHRVVRRLASRSVQHVLLSFQRVHPVIYITRGLPLTCKIHPYSLTSVFLLRCSRMLSVNFLKCSQIALHPKHICWFDFFVFNKDQHSLFISL
jgi:hypothetical protein